MMQPKKPIYVTRKDTCLAKDYIIPYGGRIRASSESKRKAAKLRLLGVRQEENK